MTAPTIPPGMVAGGKPVAPQSAHRDEIERLRHPFYIRWTSGPDYERAYLCVEDGDADMLDFATLSFREAGLFKAALSALAPAPEVAAELRGPKRFAEPFDGMLSNIVQAHQLRASAAIQDAQTKRETGWADTSDRAQGMRDAADEIERLDAILQLVTPSNDALREALEGFAALLESGGDDNTARALNERICCSGMDCGCRGSSVGELLAWQLRQTFAALSNGGTEDD